MSNSEDLPILSPKDNMNENDALSLNDDDALYNMDVDIPNNGQESTTAGSEETSAQLEPNDLTMDIFDDSNLKSLNPSDAQKSNDTADDDSSKNEGIASRNSPTSIEGDANVKEETSQSKNITDSVATDEKSASTESIEDATKEDELVAKTKKSTPRIVDDDELEVKKEPELEEHLSDSEYENVNGKAHDKGPSLDINADDKTRIRQTHAIIIPSYASWFNMRKIHQIERDSLPEFFNTSHPSKSPKIYANYRNFMINAYRLNPNEYLTLTSCRRNLVGDVGTLMRVHRFLNKWGLINYQVNPQFKPAYALEKLPNGSSVGLPYAGDFHVQYDTPRGLFPFNTHRVNANNVNIEKLKQLVESENFMNGEKTTSSEDKTSDEPPSKKQKKSEDDWSPKELANLLLGIKKYKNDWYKIAKHVGDRKPQECILKFLSIPIEDEFDTVEKKDLGILKFAPNFPVTSVDNPVISNLIFMTTLVDNEVVKAASSRASKVIDERFLERVQEVYKDKEEEQVMKESENENEGRSDQHSSSSKPSEGGDEELDSLLKETSGSGDTGVIEDAATAVFGSVAARSHLFANYEEREMQKITTTILNQELNKIDVKLTKIKELEKIFQRERQNLAQQQNEVFLDRLALAKSTAGVTSKLNEVISILKGVTSGGASNGSEDIEKASKLLTDVQPLLFKANGKDFVPTEKKDEEPANAEDEANKAAKRNSVVKPLSIERPQSFKVWVP
ncbi:putative SWI/SNF complex subunit [Clavispora lusitaniae]|uniref:SWI/SNF complex subunit n=1 Tax=Clavispora lusitaniae TaxID=36911 RepID=A0AA91PZY2_CLALS|nr:putative SWI/SNF complex subunit [Clavispora lusitaniae]